MGRVLASALVAMAVVLAAGPGTITLLRRLGAGKRVRPEGPARHAQKAGTPTMGGILLVVAVVAALLTLAPRPGLAGAVGAAVTAFAALGLLDDLRALALRRALGLRAREKFLGQVLLALAATLWAVSHLPEARRWVVPFTAQLWEPPLALAVAVGTLAVVGSANAVNLTDGLDGLAAGSVAIASTAYAGIGWAAGNADLAVLAAAVAGACLGFLWFNGFPAQVFMGDTGSLALGCALAMMALLSGTVLVLPLLGGLFVAETVSVMVQVAYFRLTGGRRLLRMSPLHHHLELSGWAEPQVVVRLWLVAALFAAVGWWAATGGGRGAL